MHFLKSKQTNGRTTKEAKRFEKTHAYKRTKLTVPVYGVDHLVYLHLWRPLAQGPKGGHELAYVQNTVTVRVEKCERLPELWKYTRSCMLAPIFSETY